MRSPSIAVGTALRADGIRISYGDRLFLDGLALVAAPGDRIGLIGENGAGKSTLLRILAGVEEPDEGAVAGPTERGWLSQEVRVAPDATVGDLVEQAIAPLRALEHELTASAAAMAAVSSGIPMPHAPERSAGADSPTNLRDAADRYAAALDEAERRDLWSLDARRDELRTGLGVGRLGLGTPVSAISGGQRSRVALAALLLARPEVLLLDEPTNHLDDQAVAFLSQHLREWRGAMVFASHDRAFLDEVATDLVDIDPARHGITRYGGGTHSSQVFGDYLVEKAAERARWEQQFALEGAEQSHLEHAVTVTARELAPGRDRRDGDKMAYDFKAGTHQSQVRRRVRNAQGRLDHLLESRIGEPPPLLSFAGIPHGSQVLDGDEPLLTATDLVVAGRLELPALEVRPDARLLVTGPNGAGKSTLLETLAGRIAADGGGIRRRKGLRIGLLTQDVRWDDPASTPRRLYTRAVGEARAEARPLVELGLIAERDLDRSIGRLSIGQQRRMALALVIAKPPHVFLLDEPTNHLSLSLATELEDALGAYPGAVIVASHDRWLRRRWTGPELALAGGRMIEKEAA